jgi:hypothetical protein
MGSGLYFEHNCPLGTGIAFYTFVYEEAILMFKVETWPHWLVENIDYADIFRSGGGDTVSGNPALTGE